MKTEIENEDVISDSSTDDLSLEEEEVETKSGDKGENFKKLREKLKATEKERNNLLKEKKEREELELSKEKTSRDIGKDNEENEDEDEESKNTQKLLFERDKRKAVRRWNKDNEVSIEMWDKIRTKVSLMGNEDDEEIYDKISDAYGSLPEIKKKREAELKAEGAKEAKKRFTDEEVDIGGGGEPSSKESFSRITSKGKRWLESFGVDEKELKEK